MPTFINAERRVAIALAGVVLLATNLPYIAGYCFAPPGEEFGGVVMNFEDSYSYLAKMLQGAQGRILYQIPFTSEEHPAAFLGTFYFLWGWLARLTAWPLIIWWHLARILSSGLLLAGIYLFISHFLPNPGPRLFAFSLASFGSGLGWLLLFTSEKFIPDFQMPEAHPFFTMLTFPHFSFATAMLLITFLFVLLYLERGATRYSLAAGVTALLLTITLPYLILVVFAVLLFYFLLLTWRREMPGRERVAGLWPVIVFPAPLLLYQSWVLITNPVFGNWRSQAVTPSPPPGQYILAYGVILLLALLGWRTAWRGRDSALLVSWALGIITLLYLPLNPQRRMIQGVHVPLTILAAYGTYDYLLPRLQNSRFLARLISWRPAHYNVHSLRRFLLIALVLLTIPSNLYIIGSLQVTAAHNPFPFFREKEEGAAVDWLAENAAPDAVVLASYESGSYIPSRARVRVFLGHWAETGNFQEKYNTVQQFFAPRTTDAWRVDLLQRYGIDYIFYGPREKTLGDFQPDTAPFLEEIFANHLVSIYRFLPSMPS